jgi:hypothetical protein
MSVNRFSFLKYLLQEESINQNSNSNNNSVLVIDTNLGLEHALRFGRDGYKTYYAIDTHQPYPKIEDEISGLGFNEIIKIQDFGQALDKVKYIIFTDSGFGYLAQWLRSKGYFVHGSDPKSERLELDRVYVREVLSSLGIDIPPGKVVEGVEGVVQAVKEAKDTVFVKISRYRGAVETFGTNDPEEAEFLLTQGGFKIIGNKAKFVVEQKLNGIEIGVDAWFNGKEFIPFVANTIEVKGLGNATSFSRIEDSVWFSVLKKLEPWLAKNGYVGMFCLEGFYDGNHLYVTDVTPRMPFICSYAYPKVFKNYSEFMLDLIQGSPNKILPEPLHKYSVQMGVYTDSIDKWKKIEYSRNDIEWIAFRRVIKKNGNYWYVPGDPVVAAGISSADNLNDAMLQAIERAKSISTTDAYVSGYDFYYEILKILEEGRKYNFKF